jgi:hypothetical protein
MSESGIVMLTAVCALEAAALRSSFSGRKPFCFVINSLPLIITSAAFVPSLQLQPGGYESSPVREG